MSRGIKKPIINSLGSTNPNHLIGHEVRYVPITGSTMDDVTNFASYGAKEGIVLVADEQTSGRGRHGRQWVSSPGKDLLFSILFRPRPAIAVELQMVLTLAIADVVDAACTVETSIKWPNDVRVNGAKVAGILLESSQGAHGLSIVAGIGLNVNSELQGKDVGRNQLAVSMSDISGSEMNRKPVLDSLLARIDSLYTEVRNGGTLVPAWRDRLETIGRQVEVSFTAAGAAQHVISGMAEDVDESGRLIVRDANARLWPVSAGEVTLQSPTNPT
jgi:BirA family biotin operon repressor/biotin-[acetyl-CoA-carboxylase] ligase